MRRLLFALMLLAVVVPAAAAISFRSASSAEASGTSLTLTKPAGLAENDVMVAVVTVRNNPSVTSPAGWTERQSNVDGTAMTQKMYTKVAGAGEPASYAWTLGSAQPASGAVAAYRGVDATTPYDTSSGQANAASTSVLAPPLTTAVANEMLVGFFGTEYQSSFTPPASMVERADAQSTSGLLPLDRTATELADVVQASASSTGSKTATTVDSAANIGQLLALRPPSLAFSSASSSGSEAATTVNLAVALSGASSLDATVDYAVTGGTATGGGTDYTLASGTLTVTAGTTSQDILVTVASDALDEPDETLTVTLSNPGNANLGATAAHVYTVNDDDPAPTVTLGVSGSPMAEAAGGATVTATLSAASGQTVTVNLAFSGTATLTSDYTRSGTSISVGPGSTSGSMTLAAVQDALDEAAETVVVDVDSVTNGAESGTQQVTASITDDDPAPTVTLGLSGSPMAEAAGSATVTATLSAASGLDVTVDLAFAGAATLTSDYTRSGTSIAVPAGSTTGSVTLTAVQDALDEAAEPIVVDVDAVTNGAESGTQQVTATVTDDDAAPTVTLGLGGSPFAEAAGSATVTATLAAASGLDVTVNLAFAGTATLTSDYTRSGTSIAVPAGSTSGSVTLTAVQDALDEAAETVLVDVDTVTNGAESGTQQVTASITDDDDAPTVTLGLSGSPMAEAAGSATVAATLSAASGLGVTVDLLFSGTATLTSDYTRSGTTISVAAGATTGSIMLTAVQDALVDAAETVVVDIDTVTNGAESGTQQVTATITDDDSPGLTVAESGGATSVTELAGTDTFTVVLALAPTSDVVLSLTSGDLGEAAVAPATLTFTTADWNAAQTVTVTGVQDNVVDGVQSATITVAVVAASSADEYDAVADATVTVAVPDSGVAGGGGGGGGAPSPSAGSGAQQAVAAYPSAPATDHGATYASDIRYAPADSRLEVLLPDEFVPRLVLELDGDLEQAQFRLVRGDGPPEFAPLPEGTSSALAVEVVLSAEHALAAAYLHLQLPSGDVVDPEGAVWAYWNGESWEALHRVAFACDANACTGEAVTTHFSLFALLFDDQAPVVSLELLGAGPGAALVAHALDNLGKVARVEFFVDGAPAPVEDAAPFRLDLPENLVGRHSVRAVARDVAGNSRLIEEWVTLLDEGAGDAPSSGDQDDARSPESARPFSLVAGAVAGIAALSGGAAWGLWAFVRHRRQAGAWRAGVRHGEAGAVADAEPIRAFTHREEVDAPTPEDDVAAMLRRDLRR